MQEYMPSRQELGAITKEETLPFKEDFTEKGSLIKYYKL